MTPNERMVASAFEVVHGRLGVPKGSNGREAFGYCLAQTRMIVEHAFTMHSHEWYEHYVTEWVQPPGYNRTLGHWARDAERSLRNLGMSVAIDERLPGDIVFDWKSAYSPAWNAYVGHVGVLLTEDLVLENINPDLRRGKSFSRGVTSVTPLSEWRRVTMIARFFPRGNE